MKLKFTETSNVVKSIVNSVFAMRNSYDYVTTFRKLHFIHLQIDRHTVLSIYIHNIIEVITQKCGLKQF